MQNTEPFVSYGQNGEDVVLNRVFAGISQGTYIEVGANHPRVDSISRSFYDRGWSGIAVEPNPAFAEMFRSERPRDRVVEAAITDSSEPTVTFHVIEGTGLSTVVDDISAGHASEGYTITDLVVATKRLDSVIEEAGLSDSDIHFLMIDTEGAELQVLRSVDLTKYRPWVLVIEATAPGTTVASHDSWESRVIGAGYDFCLFDGLSRFYAASEKSAEFKAAISYPASAADRFVTDYQVRLHGQIDSARAAALDAQEALADLKNSRSWRITSPLRALAGTFGATKK